MDFKKILLDGNGWAGQVVRVRETWKAHSTSFKHKKRRHKVTSVGV
jgi:hypothetical protein